MPIRGGFYVCVLALTAFLTSRASDVPASFVPVPQEQAARIVGGISGCSSSSSSSTCTGVKVTATTCCAGAMVSHTNEVGSGSPNDSKRDMSGNGGQGSFCDITQTGSGCFFGPAIGCN